MHYLFFPIQSIFTSVLFSDKVHKSISEELSNQSKSELENDIASNPLKRKKENTFLHKKIDLVSSDIVKRQYTGNIILLIYI